MGISSEWGLFVGGGFISQIAAKQEVGIRNVKDGLWGYAVMAIASFVAV